MFLNKNKKKIIYALAIIYCISNFFLLYQVNKSLNKIDIVTEQEQKLVPFSFFDSLLQGSYCEKNEITGKEYHFHFKDQESSEVNSNEAE